MNLKRVPLHNVERIEITRGDGLSAELTTDTDVVTVAIHSVQFDDPDRVSFGTHSGFDLRAEYESAMCKITDADGHRILHCQEW